MKNPTATYTFSATLFTLLFPALAVAEKITLPASEAACLQSRPAAWSENKKQRVCDRLTRQPRVTKTRGFCLGSVPDSDECAWTDSTDVKELSAPHNPVTNQASVMRQSNVAQTFANLETNNGLYHIQRDGNSLIVRSKGSQGYTALCTIPAGSIGCSTNSGGVGQRQYTYQRQYELAWHGLNITTITHTYRYVLSRYIYDKSTTRITTIAWK